MPASTLAATAVIHLATALSFMFVGRAVLRMRHDGSHGAMRALVAWWWGLGAYLLVESGVYFASAATGPDVGVYVATRLLTIPLICIAAGSLTYYMLYLFTGRAGFGWPVAILYAATAAVFAYATFVPLPTGLTVTTWLIQLDGTRPALLFRIVYFLVGVPPIASSLALLGIAHRLESPQAYRARMVGLAILAYVGSGLVAFLGTNDAFKVAALTVMGMLASSLVLFAYYPPRAVRLRVGMAPDAAQEEKAQERQRNRERFGARSSELI